MFSSLNSKLKNHSYEYAEGDLMEENIAATTIVNGNSSTENQTIKYTPGKAITLGSDTFYYIKDGHGDVKEITDRNGDTVVNYSYDAWGNLTSIMTTSSASTSLNTANKLAEMNPYTYAGYHYDSDTGMYYLNARYYDPISGRFISKDPVKADNLYHYTANNPVNAVDPSGERLSLLKKGSSGNQVRILQDAIHHIYNWYPDTKRYSALKLSRDGAFGPLTKKGVETFQFIYGIKSDGIVGPVTWNALLRSGTSARRGSYFHVSRDRNTDRGVSSLCRDNNGFYDGNWIDTSGRWGVGKQKFTGSDCYYSINWAGRLFNRQKWNSHSVCYYGEYSPTVNSKIPRVLRRYFGMPTTPRLCSTGTIGETSYPEICSTYLPQNRVMKWRRNFSEYWDFNWGTEYVTTLILPLKRSLRHNIF